MTAPVDALRRTGDDEAHRETVTETFDAIVTFLVELLGQSLVAYIADVSKTTVGRWASGSVTNINPISEKRIRTTYHIARLLLSHDANHTVRAWFIGMNPQLDDVAPADALREDRLRETLVSARAFLGGA